MSETAKKNLDRRESNSSIPVGKNGTSFASASRRRASMFDPIDPTELQKTLYQSKINNKLTNETNISENSNLGETIGTVEFGIQYLSDTQKLVVDILRIFDLQYKDNNADLDIYCKCSLMPDKLSFQTKTVKRSSNPIFEEQFDFDYLDVSKLESRYLEISIYELDKLSKDDCLGMATIKLNYSNIESKKIFLRDLKPPSFKNGEDNYVGDLMFSLAYLPAAERLTIVVMKARNLSRMGIDKKSPPDPFVKVSLIDHDGKKLKKKKTSTQKSTTTPTFNEEVVFTRLKKEKLADISIYFQIFHDSITNREELGNLTISGASKGNVYTQWKDMIDGKKSIAWWQNLQLQQANNSNTDSDSNTNSPPASGAYTIANGISNMVPNPILTSKSSNHHQIKHSSSEKSSKSINSMLKHMLSNS